MDDDDYSPSNSVTSVNSLASLLREKLQVRTTSFFGNAKSMTVVNQKILNLVNTIM